MSCPRSPGASLAVDSSVSKVSEPSLATAWLQDREDVVSFLWAWGIFPYNMKCLIKGFLKMRFRDSGKYIGDCTVIPCAHCTALNHRTLTQRKLKEPLSNGGISHQTVNHPHLNTSLTAVTYNSGRDLARGDKDL